MTPPIYDPEKHAIAIGGYGFNLLTYTKRNQEHPIEKVRVGTGDLVGNERLSYWTQEDYSGGNYQYEWADPAMVANTAGIVPSQASRSVRTIPNLVWGWSVDSARIETQITYNNVPLAGFTYGTSVFFCFANMVVKLTILGGSAPAVHSYYYQADGSWNAFYLDRESNRLFCGGVDGKVRAIRTSDLALVDQIAPRNEDGRHISGAVNAIGMFGDKLMAAFGRTLYLLKENEGLRESGSEGGGWDTSSVWVRTGSTDEPSAGVLPARPIQMEPYNGQMYILCGNKSREGFVAASSGQDVITICQIPYAVTPRSMCQYNGRLFIGCGGYDLSSNEHFGELHELSGNSLRLVRTFKKEADTGRQRVQTIRWMDVQEGLLWFPGPNGWSLECYEGSADAFFTGPSMPPEVMVPGAKVVMVLGYRDMLLAWVDHPVNGFRGVYRTKRSQLEHGPSEYSWIITSDFGPEPARKKGWANLVVETRNDGCGTAQASTDGGASWITLPTTGTERNGALWYTGFSLAGVVPSSRRIRLRLSIHQPTFNRSAELLSHTLAFTFTDNGKHGWQITIPCVHHVEREDGTKDAADSPADLLRHLWQWADQEAPITFTDRDGTTHWVMMTQCVESEGVINPKGVREAAFSTYLVEV